MLETVYDYVTEEAISQSRWSGVVQMERCGTDVMTRLCAAQESDMTLILCLVETR